MIRYDLITGLKKSIYTCNCIAALLYINIDSIHYSKLHRCVLDIIHRAMLLLCYQLMLIVTLEASTCGYPPPPEQEMPPPSDNPHPKLMLNIKNAIRPKKLIISFSGHFFSKINEAGRLYFLFFIASDQNEGFYFFPAMV